MPSSLSWIISSSWFKLRDVQLFLSLEHLEAIVVLLPCLIPILLWLRNRESQGEGETWGMAGWWSSQQTLNIYWLSSPSYMDMVRGGPKQLESNIKDHWSQITITNIIIVKKFEILWELPKCDRDTKWANQTLLEKKAPINLFDAGLPQDFNLLTTQCVWSTILKNEVQ